MSNPKKPTDIGENRTGIATRSVESKKTIEGAREAVPARSFNGTGIESVRVGYSEIAEPVGTMPPPTNLKGLAKTATEAIKGHRPSVLLDLVGDRLAFERTGVRIYEALLAKYEAAHDRPGAPSRAEIELIRDQELAHVGVLEEAMTSLGGDPTALTPTADICAVASSGIIKVVSDPRTTLTHALHAVQIAELADNDAWTMLEDLASRLGHDELAANFRQALVDEERHLDNVRLWLTASIEAQAGLEPSVVSEATLPAP